MAEETNKKPQKEKQQETEVVGNGINQHTAIVMKSSDYSSVMDALFMLKAGDSKMSRYAPLTFLTTMKYADSKAWVANALAEYAETIYKEGEPRSWPIARCLKVLEARKARRSKKTEEA